MIIRAQVRIPPHKAKLYEISFSDINGEPIVDRMYDELKDLLKPRNSKTVDTIPRKNTLYLPPHIHAELKRLNVKQKTRLIKTINISRSLLSYYIKVGRFSNQHYNAMLRFLKIPNTAKQAVDPKKIGIDKSIRLSKIEGVDNEN
jgi:hypothetical protein